MKKISLLAVVFAAASVNSLHAQIEFVANGSTDDVTSIPGTSGPGELGYYIFTDDNDANSANIGYDTTGSLADFAPTSYDTTDSSFSSLTISGVTVQTADQETISTSNDVVLATITLGADAPSSFQLGFLEDNSDGTYYENLNNLTLSANGSVPVTIAAYNTAQDYGTNDFYYIDVLNAAPGDVITLTGSTAYSADQLGQYAVAFGGITFDTATPLTYTWTGAGNGTFDNSQGTSTPSNYTGGTGSNFPGAIDTAQFNVTSHTAVSLTGNDLAGSLVFGSNGSNASSYTFSSTSGYTLGVGNGIFVDAGVNGATETFNNTISAVDFSSGGTIVNQGSNSVLNFVNIAGNTGVLIAQGGQAYGSESAGGREINVSGSITGGIGLTGNLAGAVMNLENTNSYSGPTTMNSGVLEYTGSATSGTPFGTGSITLNGGRLDIDAAGSGTIALTGATNSGATFTYGTGGQIQITAPVGGTVTYTVGSGSGTVFNSSTAYANTNPTLIIETSQAATLGTTENLVINGNAPTLTNGIVGDNVVAESASNGFGSYVTYGATGTTGFSDYTGATLLVNPAADPASGGSSTTNYVVGPAGATLSGFFSCNTMTVTDGALNGGALSFDGSNGSSGLILNDATMSTSLSLSGTGYIYTGGNSTISSLINSEHNDLAITGPGTLTLTGETGGGYYYLGAYDLDGPGALSVANAGELGSGTVNAGNTPTSLVFSGGTLDTTGTMALDEANGTGTGANAVVVNTGGGTFDVANGTTLAVTGVISGTGPLNKTDGGTMIATGDNTFTGALTIGAVDYQTQDSAVTNPSTTSGGTLLLTGSNTATLTTVTGNGTLGSSVLGGTGSITATNSTDGASGLFIQNGGRLAPGIVNANSTAGLTGLTTAQQSSGAAGTFTFTGAGNTQSSVNFTNGGNLEFTLADDKDSSTGTAGTDFSQLVLNGNTLLQLGGTSSVTVNMLSGVSPTNAFWDSDHTWQIVLLADGATSDGTIFSSVTDADYADGSFSVMEDADGIELVYAVPEPSTVALFGLGLAAMGWLAWRRRKMAFGVV